MGTVGLSFGSPTGGNGFDVSATVAAIVGNLKNVETPWNTQLAALQKQDTAISSLGTLLSNLSNDVSSLTDLQGILAQKTGSSSDTNVLQLTSADNKSVAGTHTVTVTSLASSSSGYLDKISDASDTLSGSITLQVGNGAAQTIKVPASINTLSGLASAINSSGVGISASLVTDSSGSRLSLVSGTSGAGGNITVSENQIVDTTRHLNYTGAVGTSSAPSTGTLTSIVDASDKLSGSISIQVGNSKAQTITVDSSSNTLSTLSDAINTASIGVTASVVTNASDGTSSLQLVSNTPDKAGTLTVNSKIVDTSSPGSTALGYTSPVAGEDAILSVDGVSLISSSNTVANFIPGVTFQMLAPSKRESDDSLERIQVVIGNDITDTANSINKFVSDFNALVSAVSAQEGLDSSGNAEPLFGSPTLSLLQQQLLGGLNLQNPNGYLDSIASNTNTTLAGSMTFQVGGGKEQTLIFGDAPSSPAADTIYVGSGVNTLSGLADAINAAAAGTTLSYSGTNGTETDPSTGTLTAIPDANLALRGSISIQVGSGTAENFDLGATPAFGAKLNTIYMGDSAYTLSDLAGAINTANIGVQATVTTPPGGVTTLSLSCTRTLGTTLTVNPDLVAAGIGVAARVVTSGTQSSLALLSQTAGANGVVTLDSNLVATSDTHLNYSGTAGTPTQASYGALDSIPHAGNTLTGSISIKVGNKAAQTVTLDSSNNTLSGLADAINKANIGVTAQVGTDSKGLTNLVFESQTEGTAGTLTVTSNILDSTNTTSKALNYTNSSDISTLANLGITVSAKADGSLDFSVASLTSALNSDFGGVIGFFQNMNSWGQNFSTMLHNIGNSSTTGLLSLAAHSNSSTESMLNANIAREESMISAQQKSLTAELIIANEIMQALPRQLQGINQLYSAITGYNQNH